MVLIHIYANQVSMARMYAIHVIYAAGYLSDIYGQQTQFDGREVINSPNFSTKADLEPHGTWVA